MKFRAALVAAFLCASCAPANNAAVRDAWAQRRSGAEVTLSGRVTRVLGTRQGRSGAHEGFVVRVAGAPPLTVLVEDNVGITGPIPVRSGDEVTVRGEYVYDSRGGILHWTHHDPRGRHAGGYVKIDGSVYQ